MKKVRMTAEEKKAKYPNLLMGTIKTSEQAAAMGTLCKGISTPKKRLAAKIGGLKRKSGWGDEVAQHLLEVMTDPDLSALDILQYIKKLRPEDFKDQAIYIKVLTDWHKMHHGIKKESPDVQVNIQNNNNTVIREDLKELYEEATTRWEK